MITLLRFLLKHYFVLLFAILESIALMFVVRDNPYQNSSINNLALNFNGFVAMKQDNFSHYLHLTDVNEKLALENDLLKNQLSQRIMFSSPQPSIDSSLNRYHYVTAKVINNSINKSYNYIILNKGKLDGIEPEMAVISSDGVVGIVHQVTDHFSQVMSVLNEKLPITCKFKKNQYFGSFVWSGHDHRKGNLNNIPLHLEVKIGDTLVSTGFGIFPEGILVGYVSKAEKGNSNFYKIEVELSNDFRKLYYVYVVKDSLKKEEETIEKIK